MSEVIARIHSVNYYYSARKLILIYCVSRRVYRLEVGKVHTARTKAVNHSGFTINTTAVFQEQANNTETNRKTEERLKQSTL